MRVLEDALGMTLTMSAGVAELAIGFSMAVGVIFGLYPANKASKLKPIDARTMTKRMGGGTWNKEESAVRQAAEEKTGEKAGRPHGGLSGAGGSARRGGGVRHSAADER